LRQLPSDITDEVVTVRTFTVAARDGYDIPVRSYVPTAQSPARPVLVYLHAGGFLFGDLESGDLNCRLLAARLDISVVNVGYRLAPAWPFPHGVNDAYDVTKWVRR
jgi:acetyl esterase/lipase